MKIKLKNFQSIKEADLEFSPGLTLITGPTNSGKTAIFRSLYCLLLNPAKASSKIHNDQEELVVKMQEDSVGEIEFHRTSSQAWYLVNNKKFSKLSRSNIFDVCPEIHKLFVYNPEDPRKILNFQTESNLAFPFDRSDAEMFKLFEKIFNITDTRAIMDTIKKDEEETKFKLNQNISEKSEIELRLKVYDENLKGFNIERLKNAYELYKYKSSKILELQNKIRKIMSYAPYLKASSEIPNFESVEESDKVQKILELKKKIQECKTKKQFINNYQEVIFSPIDEKLLLSIPRMQSALENIKRISLAIKEQSELVEKSENRIAECNKKLEEFKMCPLCGHELKE